VSDLTTARLAAAISCLFHMMPGLALAQADCGSPVMYPAGATCSGGSSDGHPCYVFDAADNFGCPGGTCITSPGGGRATFYDAASGACGIPVDDPQAMVAAVAEHLWEGSAVCGRCVRVTGPLGTVLVEITDLCPAGPNPEWCGGDAAHLDLSRAAFAAVADPDRGVAYVDWEIVECPVLGSISLLNKDGINQWWYAFFVLDIRQGITGVDVMDASGGGSWLTAVRQSYNAFVVQSASGLQLPFSVRLTGVTGQMITSPNVVTDLAGLSEFDFGDQFDPCSLFSDGFESGDDTGWSASAP
jgi:expansin (peptidoglycan-binding protein)